MTLSLNPGPKKDPRMLAIGLAVGAAVLLLFAALSKQWLGNPAMNDIGFGPMGCKNCCLMATQADCGLSNGAFVEQLRTVLAGDPHADKYTSGAFAPMGWATFGLCIIAALGLLAGAFVAFKNKRPDLPVSPPSIALMALMVVMITGCVFVATKPGQAGFVGVNMGFWAFGIGTVMGIIAAQMLAKVIRPVDPDLLDGAMNPEQY